MYVFTCICVCVYMSVRMVFTAVVWDLLMGFSYLCGLNPLSTAIFLGFIADQTSNNEGLIVFYIAYLDTYRPGRRRTKSKTIEDPIIGEDGGSGSLVAAEVLGAEDSADGNGLDSTDEGVPF